tara:strand:+ start:83 stop:292 length:210 start_codon:yes stop_codon:yes gene_type:complete
MEKEKFYDLSDYQSKITPELQVVGTDDLKSFTRMYLNPEFRKTKKLIGTHSGAFHCDEALATALLLRTN